MVTFLMMSAKMATLGFLKIKVFQIKGYDVIISGYDVTKKSWLKLYCRFGHETKVW